MSDSRSLPAQPPKPVAPAPALDASKVMTLFVMVVVTLYFGREVLLPIVLALLLAFILAPLVELLRRLHLGRIPSVLLGVVLALGIVLAIGSVIGTQVADLTRDLPRYASTVEQKVASLRHYTTDQLSQLSQKVGMQDPMPSGTPQEAGKETTQGGRAAPTVRPDQPYAPVQAQTAATAPSSPLELIYHYLAPVLSPLATLGIVFVVAVFALLQREDLRDRLIRLVGSDDLHRTTLAIDDGERRLSRYFVSQLSINTVFSVVIGAGLFFIGVPNPMLWGILSGLLRFVPYVGSFIAAVLPLGMAAAVEPGWSMVLWTAALYVLVEGLTAQVVEPLVYGHSTGLSPFSVVVAAIFWSWLWGPVGLILSTPLTLCLVVMGRHVQRLEFLDVMLGDRPALTPVESFYQRILAGDADETEDHADGLLKECSLSTYYDEVALKGLQLAANDARRGAVGHDQLERIRATVMALVHGLDRYDDRQPTADKSDNSAIGLNNGQALPHNPDPGSVPEAQLPASWREPAKVLCIAGRGPLDEAAAAMLAQLLGKHGMGARVIGYSEVSRESIATLDAANADMACVSYLDLNGSPAHLRYLVQRLRQCLPRGTPILVGMWPATDTALSDKSVQASIGADYFTGSLAQSITSCVEAAKKADDADTRCVNT